MEEDTEERWKELNEALLSDMKAWRLAHPRATLYEIEEAVSERMEQLKAQLLQASTQMNAQRAGSSPPEEERPRCRMCELLLRERKAQASKPQAKGRTKGAFKAVYGTCPLCGATLSPSE